MARRIALRSPLDPVALATRLKTTVPATIDGATGPQVIGRGSEQDMTMWYYRPRFHNDLATRLVATIDADGSGSVIRGRIGTPTVGTVFLGCWFAFVAVFLVGAIGFALTLRPGLAAIGPFLAVSGAMLAFGILFTWVATRNSRRDAAAILDFLARTVDARPI